MVGVNPFTLDGNLQGILVNPANWDFVKPALETTDILPKESFLKINNLMPMGMTALLRMVCETHQWLAVGLDGFANEQVPDKVGNYRLSNWNPELANILWKRIQVFLPFERIMDAWTPTDHEGHYNWRPVGVSPLLRFIRYKEGGQLVGHYDAAYRESDSRRTLMSLVIYLTTNACGATRFLRDPQIGKRMDEMDFNDWDRAGRDDEVILLNKPSNGDAILFDHRLLHDGEPLGLNDPEKVIIRTDIVFEKA